MTLGTIFHMMIIFVPLMVLGQMALRMGMVETYSEELGGIIQQPTLFGRTISLILELIGAYFFVIINATAVVMYIKTDNYAMMWKFGPLLLEAMHNVGRNLIYIVNMMLFGVILLILFYIGSMFFIIPGMFALAAGNLGYFYMITYWMKKLENTPQG